MIKALPCLLPDRSWPGHFGDDIEGRNDPQRHSVGLVGVYHHQPVMMMLEVRAEVMVIESRFKSV